MICATFGSLLKSCSKQVKQKRNSPIISDIYYTCAFPALAGQNICLFNLRNFSILNLKKKSKNKIVYALKRSYYDKFFDSDCYCWLLRLLLLYLFAFYSPASTPSALSF